MEDSWEQWEYVVQRILYDFNEDVFGGNGSIRENFSYEKPYMVVETKKRSLCIFPRQGNIFVVVVVRGCFHKEYVNLDYAVEGFEHENIIAFDKFSIHKAEQSCRTTEDKFWYLEQAIKIFYRKHWSALST